jgi:hypothetical protein
VLTKERLEALINDRAFTDLVGETENEFFDCKSGIYDLSNPSKKLELAKDVSSFANADGGFLLLGIQTERRATQSLDVIARLTPFAEALLKIEQCHNVINDWIYPRIENLTVQWVSEKTGNDRGFGIIKIPIQDQARRPFLITRTLTESGKFSEVLFGYAQRSRDTSTPFTVVELHQLIRDGLNFHSSVEQRFDAIDAKLDSFSRPSVQPPTIDKSEIIARLNQAVAASSLQDESHLAVAAWPEPLTSVTSIFKTGQGSLGSLIDHPPILRPGGFSVSVGVPSRSIEGKLRRANTKGQTLDLYRDGTLIYATGQDNLCWAMNRPTMNTLALVEVVYDFFLLYAEVIHDMSAPASSIKIMVRLENAQSGGLQLVPDVIRPAGIYYAHSLSAPTNRFEYELEIAVAEFDPRRAAFVVLNELFIWYGGEAEDVPYSTQADGVWTISEEAIRRGGRG